MEHVVTNSVSCLSFDRKLLRREVKSFRLLITAKRANGNVLQFIGMHGTARYVENACGLVDRMDVFLKRFYRVVPHRPGVEKNLSSEEKFYVMPGFSAREPLGVPYGFVKLAAGKSRGYDPRNGFMPNKEELLRLGGSNAEFLQTRAVKMRKKKKGSTTGGGAAGSAGSPEKAGDMEVSGEFGSGKAALTSGI